MITVEDFSAIRRHCEDSRCKVVNGVRVVAYGDTEVFTGKHTTCRHFNPDTFILFTERIGYIVVHCPLMFIQRINHRRSDDHIRIGQRNNTIFDTVIRNRGFRSGRTNGKRKLIAAFRATLEEVTEADLLLHVVDSAHPYFEDQIQAVYTVLEELKCISKPMITVFNKIDNLAKKVPKEVLKKYEPSIAVSALHQQGMEELQEELTKFSFPSQTQ